MPLTDDQKKAVESRFQNVFVTASAGAGKTSTMVERVIGLVTGDDHVPLSSIIMLTFTRAAAEEMRTRLGAALISAIKEAVGEKREALVHALDELPLFTCSTIDAFCQKTVKEHFESLGLTPLHSVMEEDQISPYRTKALTTVLDRLEAQDRARYQELLDSFGGRDEKKIEEAVIKVYKFIMTTEKGLAFLDDVEAAFSDSPENMLCIKDLVRETAVRAEMVRNVILQRNVTFPPEVPVIRKKVNNYLNCLDAFAHCSTLADLYHIKKEVSIGGTLGNDADKTEWVIEYDAIKDIFAKFLEGISFIKCKNYEADMASFANVAKETRILLQVVREFDAEYRAAKDADRILEFFDVEQGMYKLLQEQNVAEEFGCRYLLVDECQDLNPLQDAIIRGIVGENDLFMVGDVKQSIFRFRLSAPDLFLGRLNGAALDPEHSQVIEFKENFRSSDAVIAFVNHVFSNIMHRELGGVDYRPVNRGDRHAGSGQVRCFFYEPEKVPSEYDHVYSVHEAADKARAKQSVDEEALWVRDRIREIIHTPFRNTKTDEEFLLSYKDIAIVSIVKMAPGNKQEMIVNCLREAGIPVNLTDFIKEADYTEIASLVDFLRLIESPNNDVALLSVLHSDAFAISPQELAEIALLPGNSFAEKAQAAAQTHGRISEFYSFLEKMRFLSSSLSLYELVSRMLEEKWRNPILNRPDGRKIFGELLGFADSLKQSKYAGSISEYLDYFDFYFKANGVGEVEERDAVNVMSIHKSKGLEYPVVFVIGLEHSIERNSTDSVLLDKEYGIIKKQESANLFNLLFINKKKREQREDRLRLLYVALTRAKNNLYLSGALTREHVLPFVIPETSAEWIVQGMIGAYDYERKYVPLPESEVKKEERPSVAADENEVAALQKAFDYEYPYQKATETGIKYTVTSINAMDEEGYAPATELFPEEKKAKGTAFHLVMEEIPFSLQNEAEVDAFLQKLIQDGKLTEQQRSDLRPKQVFSALQKVRALVGNRTVMREKSFLLHSAAKEIGLANISDRVEVQGKIDLLALGETDAMVLDYKLSALSAQELREKYREQLTLYAMAVEKGFGKKVTEKYIFVLGRNELITL